MRWRRKKRSPYLRDERAQTGGRSRAIPIGAAGGGIGGIIILLLFLFLSGGLGGDGGGGTGGVPPIPQFPTAPGPAGGGPDPEAKLVDFVSFVLDDVQGTWQELFRRSGETYQPAELVLYRRSTDTGCGFATSDVGPFYCPADDTVYLDLGFFQELEQRFGAPGDFAQAYVIAHELGHHVQDLLGIEGRVERLSQQHPDQANALSIDLELQADCLAGVWGHSTYERDILEKGDLQEGLDAAAAVGDDRIQKQATGRIDRESWTHGSSKQRTTWFSNGFDTGDPDRCDTFGA